VLIFDMTVLWNKARPVCLLFIWAELDNLADLRITGKT
jgi:hypothetical protein